jgi:glycosyltransferase involved in cell wall biosynthesis
VQSLFRRARELHADVLVTIDGDGQHDPREIPSLVQPVVDGVSDVVVGSRFLDENGTAEMRGYRKLGVKVITKLVNGSTKNGVSDAQSGFRADGKRGLERLVLSEMGMSASLELLMNIKEHGLTVCEVPISCKYANNVGVKTSTKNPISHGLGLLMSIVKFVVEDRPLTVLGMPGASFLVAGVFFGVWMLDIYANHHMIVTNIALATIGFFFLGFFMLTTAMTLYAMTRLSKRLNAK